MGYLQVDTERNLLYIRGQVPGPAGRMVLLRDAFNVQVCLLIPPCSALLHVHTL